MGRSHSGKRFNFGRGAFTFVALLVTSLCGLQPAGAAIDAKEASLLTDTAAAAPFDGSVWAEPKALADASALGTTTARNVRMATDYNKHWVAAWHTNNPKSDGSQPASNSKLFVSYSNNDAGGWSDPMLLPKAPESETDYNFRPDLEHGANGTNEYVMLFEAFTSPTGTLLYKTKSTDGGATWDPSTPLGSFPTDNVNPRNVSLGSDHFGNYMAAWVADSDTGNIPGINIAFSANGVDWTFKTRIPNTAAGRPQIRCHRVDAINPGRWVIVYEQPGTSQNIGYSVSADDGASWVSGLINTDFAVDGVDDYEPRLHFAPSTNTWVVVWARDVNDPFLPGVYDIMFARATEAAFNNTDGGFTWSDPDWVDFEIPFGSVQEIDTWIATDDAQHWIALWSETTSDQPPMRDVAAAVSSDDGQFWDLSTFVTDGSTSRAQWLNTVVESSRNGRWLGMWQNVPQSPRLAGDAPTAYPWYSTTFIPLNDQQQFTDISIQPIDINGGNTIYANTDFDITYEIANLGDITAFNVNVFVTAQSPVQAYAVVDLGGAASPFQSLTGQFPAATVSGTYDQLAPGESARIKITFKSPQPGRFKIVANADAHDDQANPLIDPDQSNNVDVITYVDITKPAALADLRVTKTSYPTDVAVIGDYLGYTITVWNDSGEDAPGVVVTDPIPDGLQFVFAATSQGSWDKVTSNGQTIVTANLGTIAVGKRATLTLATIPLAGGPTSATNTACATFDGAEVNPSNNCSSASVGFVNGGGTGADLVITKTASTNAPVQGTSVTYTLAVSNAGPSLASGVKITDVLPATLSYNGEYHTQGTFSRSGNTITANIGTLAAGKTAKVNISVIPTGTGNISNSANVTAATPDPNSANNSATAQVVVTPADQATVANLSITKTANPSPATVGNSLTYTIQVNNAGPSAAANVRVQDVLPPEVAYVSSTPAETSYAGGVVSYSFASINAGASQTIQVLTNAIAAGTAVNTASVSSDNPDLTPSNNTVSISTVINPGNGQPTNADLALSSAVVPTSTTVGNAITWTLTAHNNGPQSAATIQVKTTLPSTVTFVSANGPNGSASPVGNQLTVPITVLGSGANATVTIVLVPLTNGNLTLTGTISGNVNDSVSANNSATTIVPVTGGPQFDLLGSWIKLKTKAKSGLIPTWQVKGTVSVKNLRTTLLVAAPIQFYLSDDNTFSPATDTLVGANTLKKIKPGKSKKKSVNVKLTFDPSGKYLLAVINPTGADPENVVPILIPVIPN
jgi:uncharacterized repeat protein (TIGR01451 family)